MQIKHYKSDYLEEIVRLSLRAWAPVFDSIERGMNPEIYREFYPNGWRASQQKAVEEVCASEEMQVWAATENERIVGFVAVKSDQTSKLGEIHIIAVDPDFQNQGVGAALTDFAVGQMKKAGMTVAMIETGADDGHAPARRAYEKAGFELWSVARYFKKL